MSGRGFGSLVMAASVAGAALGCYLVSLNVASERAQLESVEAEIVDTQRQIRVLQTEIGTRGRLAQLERWNANFIRLSAPSADQILEGSFQLASMVRPPAKHTLDAPMVLASAPEAERAAPQLDSDGAPVATQPAPRAADSAPRAARPDQLLHVANYALPDRSAKTKVEPKAKEAAKDSGPAKAKPAAKPKLASSDPLAPLPGARDKTPAKSAATGPSTSPQAAR